MTAHVRSADMPRENGLAAETSPYLLQHARNPVDWHAWGEEAFAAARSTDRPILVSIGYSACHWCHVMEHESFEDPETARLMNEAFICVKVDREERPDVDAIYMDACQAMTGQGGWPLNAFVTTDLKPFFVGTYFPPDARYGRPSWRQVLQRISDAWTNERDSLTRDADRMHREFRRAAEAPRPGALDADVLEMSAGEAAANFDQRHGGFGDAPKFPPDQRLALLLAAARLGDAPHATEMAVRTLHAMARGGLYDQIGGGFTRYSVDARWLIPHFEKMLYNQALLVPVYLDAALATGEADFARTAAETLDWCLTDLLSAEGGFQCAYDADSEGEEGKFYVWTPPQVAAALAMGGTGPANPADAALCAEYFGITPAGNFEHGTSNPHVPVAHADFAARHGLTADALRAKVEGWRAALLAVRRTRIWPGLDDKVLTGWNGLMITALARGAQALGDDRYRAAADDAADFLMATQFDPATGSLWRVRCKGRSAVAGVLEDYAYLADGLIDLYETTFDSARLTAAAALLDAMRARFEDPEGGGFFFAPADDPHLILRTREPHDGALPSAASVAVRALFRLGALLGRDDFAAVARRALAGEAMRANRFPQAYSSLLLASLHDSDTCPAIVIDDGGDRATGDALVRAAWRTYLPARALVRASAPGVAALPLAEGRLAGSGAPAAAHVCYRGICRLPVHHPDALTALLAGPTAGSS